MRPIRLPIALLVAVLAVSACAAAEEPGWTYAPAPPATPAPSPTGEPTEEPTEEPTGEPTEEPTGEPTEQPTGEPTGEPDSVIELVAVNIAYEELELTVPAGEPFSIHFVNDDPPGVPHDVDIETDGGEVLQDTDTIDGGEETMYEYEPLEAGEYVFQCSIHPIPNMTGTLIVE